VVHGKVPLARALEIWDELLLLPIRQVAIGSIPQLLQLAVKQHLSLYDTCYLPIGVHATNWQEFRSRFGAGTPRRLWLFGRFKALVELAASTGKLRRVFVWGSFVTAKPVPKDVDLLLIMDADFEVEHAPVPAQVVFDSIQSRLLFESDVFWARSSIGEEVLQLWLETYQTSRNLGKRGIVELELR